MPTISPTKPLSQIIVREFFPTIAAANPAPTFAATYLGPVRTVVYGKLGVLGGVDPGTVPVAYSASPASVTATITWSSNNTLPSGGTELILNFDRLTFTAKYLAGDKDHCETAFDVAAKLAKEIKADPKISSLVSNVLIDDRTELNAKYLNKVDLASTANIASLSSPGSAIDSVTLVAGMRVLLKNQSTTSQNGIYVVTSGLALVRSSDPAELLSVADGQRVKVVLGTVANGKTFVSSTNATVWTEVVALNEHAIVIKIVFSTVADSLGEFPSLRPTTIAGSCTFTSAVNVPVNAAKPATLNVSFPTLKATWSKINVIDLPNQIANKITDKTDKNAPFEPDRFIYGATLAGRKAATADLAADPQDREKRDDCIYVERVADLTNIEITGNPIEGTQRVIAKDVVTGLEYVLKHYSDIEKITGLPPGSTEYDYTVTGAGATNGVYKTGDLIVFNTSSAALTSLIGRLAIRASYVNRRSVSPLPLFSYKALSASAKTVDEYATLNEFAVDSTDVVFSVNQWRKSPVDARIPFSKTSVVDYVNNVVPLYDYRFGSLDFTSVLGGSSPIIGTVTIPLSTDFGAGKIFVAPNLVTRNATPTTPGQYNVKANGVTVVATNGSHSASVDDVTVAIVGDNYLITIFNDGPATLSSTTAKVLTVQQVTKNSFVDISLAPSFRSNFTYHADLSGGTTKFNVSGIKTVEVKTSGGVRLYAGASADFTYDSNGNFTWASSALSPSVNPLSINITYSPEIVYAGSATPAVKSGNASVASLFDIGGGRWRVYGASSSSQQLAYSLSAVAEYPVSPEIKLEFIAERNDLDGKLIVASTPDVLAANTDLLDTYESQTIAVDTSTANPTVHAATVGMSVAGGNPVFIGVGEMTTLRAAPILQRLEREFNAYHIVPITSDGEAALSVVGPHIDKVVDTFAGEQIHLNSGKVRVLYATLDQRNEVQVYPEQKDTSAGTAYFINGNGGIQIHTSLSTDDGISAGDFIEVNMLDVMPTNVLSVDSAVFPNRLTSKRIRIDAIDTSSGIKFDVSDSALPTIMTTGDYNLTRAFPFRIVRVRDDFTLASDVSAAGAAIGAASNGRRRWLRAPDMVKATDAGESRKLPGYYRSIVESALRSSLLPHQGMSRFPLPYLTGVERGIGFYANDDVINIMTDGGIDYAVQEVDNGPVFSLQQLTADRTNKYTQAPTITQIVDFVALALYFSMKQYLGVTNVSPETLDMYAATGAGVIAKCRNIRASRIGPMITKGSITKLEPLPDTSQNSGVLMCFKIAPAQAAEALEMNIFVDTESQPI